MNLSGAPLREIAQFESLEPRDVLVIVDDFMIPFGSLRLRPSGSAGGHNGLKSIIEALASEEFARLRIGIGPVPPNEDPSNFVLHRFASAELAKRENLFELTRNGLMNLFQDGFEKAMGFINKQHL